MKISTLFATAAMAVMLAGAATTTATAATAADDSALAPVAPLASAINTSDAEPCTPTATTDCDSTAQSNAAAAQVDEAPSAVPEPQTSIMLMLGLVVLGVTSRRRKSDSFDR